MKVKCVWSDHSHWFKENGVYDAKREANTVFILQDEQVSDLLIQDCWRAKACKCDIMEAEHFTINGLAVFVEA